MLDLEKYTTIEFVYNGEVIDARPLFTRHNVTLGGDGAWHDGYDFDRAPIELPSEFLNAGDTAGNNRHEPWISDILMEQAYTFMGEDDCAEEINDWDEDGKHMLGWRLLEAEPAEVTMPDGFIFKRQADGTYTDGDMLFASYRALIRDNR
jgi:hypothetical protein